MQQSTDFVKWLTKEYCQDISDQEAAISYTDPHHPENNLVTVPRRRRRTFMEYTPLEMQRIIDMAG